LVLCLSFKEFLEKGIIDEKWVANYCRSDYLNCERYKMEEKGLYHPDNMMPDGSIDERLEP